MRVQTIEEKDSKKEEIKLKRAPKDGVFPEGFYVTTNLKTVVKYNKECLRIKRPEMDCGIVIKNKKALCVPINEVKKGDKVVIGDQGVITSTNTKKKKNKEFEFMNSDVSSEKSKGHLINKLAEEMQRIKEKGGKISLVGGPAIIHTGAGKYLSILIDNGYINVLFAGNALAVHDIESAIFGTSLDKSLYPDEKTREGHGFHLKAINKIRAAGSIKKGVEKEIINKGIMYSVIKNNVDYVLAGSIRDDGPLPDVITNTEKAQKIMREKIKDSSLVLMLATMLHSIATGNLLSADMRTICVDINSDTVTKLSDRGSSQAVGIVTDVELFLSSLVKQLI